MKNTHILRHLFFFTALSIAIFSVPLPAYGDSTPLISELTAYRIEINHQGEESLLPASTAKPGDTIEYHSKYSNVSNRTLNNVKGTLPIPSGLAFIEGTAVPARYLASIDGKRFRQTPLFKTILTKDGNEKRVNVLPSEYRAIQWYIGRINPGQSQTVKCRVRIMNENN